MIGDGIENCLQYVNNFNPENLNWGGLGTNNRIHKIMYHPTIPNLVFVGTSEGIFRSEDNFESFSFSTTGNVWEYNQDYDYIEFHTLMAHSSLHK